MDFDLNFPCRYVEPTKQHDVNVERLQQQQQRHRVAGQAAIRVRMTATSVLRQAMKWFPAFHHSIWKSSVDWIVWGWSGTGRSGVGKASGEKGEEGRMEKRHLSLICFPMSRFVLFLLLLELTFQSVVRSSPRCDEARVAALLVHCVSHSLSLSPSPPPPSPFVLFNPLTRHHHIHTRTPLRRRSNVARFITVSKHTRAAASLIIEIGRWRVCGSLPR